MKLRYPDYISIYSEKSKHDFEKEDCLRFEDIRVEIASKEENLTVVLTADTSPVRYVRLRWNFSDREKRCENIKILGDEWERSYGFMEWRGISATRCMPWVCMVSNGSDADNDYRGRYTECFGVKVRPGAMCFWQYDGRGITLWLDVRCGGDGVILGGRSITLCEIVFADYYDMSAFRAIQKYYRTLCDDPLSIDHKVYGTNNWYYAYGESSQEEILEDTRLLCERCAGLENRPYMVIDDGWQINRCDGPWNVTNQTFPDMKKLAEDIREFGARPGLWFRPLSDSKFTSGLKKEEYRIEYNTAYLDPSHPEVLQYVADTVKMFTKDWGYELLKHDFSTFDVFGFWGEERLQQLAEDGWHFYDRKKTSAEIMIELYRTIYEAAKGRALILGCNVMGHLAAGYVHLNRTGSDTSGLEWEKTRKCGVNTLAFHMMHHGAFYEVDADCVGITGKIDWELNRQWMKALAVSGTPMFVSPKPGVMAEEQIRELIDAYARNSVQTDTLEPIDWMENVCPERWRLNGEEISFNWYPNDGVNSFEA